MKCVCLRKNFFMMIFRSSFCIFASFCSNGFASFRIFAKIHRSVRLTVNLNIFIGYVCVSTTTLTAMLLSLLAFWCEWGCVNAKENGMSSQLVSLSLSLCLKLVTCHCLRNWYLCHNHFLLPTLLEPN